jgi:tripartite-type tricarboxylate transporter receptor subunit TctC
MMFCWCISCFAARHRRTAEVKEMMMAFSRLVSVAAGTCLLLLAWAPDCLAQQWPSRTVRVVVPYGVGGVTDTMARLTADRLSKALKQPFVIENKPGAGGAIGVEFAMHAPQDGYTILFVGSTLFTVLPLAQKVNYVPLKDLVPVSITGTNGMVMVVEKGAPYSTLREFIDYARANPGKITFASGGPATNNHLDTAYLAGREKLDMVHVPFGGGQAALTAVLSKSVDMHFGNSSDLIESVRSGSVKALAVSTRERMPQLPDVPAVAETIPGFEYVAWNGYAVTGGVPPEVAQRLSEALRVIARDPEVIKVFANLGIESVGTTPQEAAESLRKDMPIFSQMVDMAGVRRK